uniref:CSON013778 protein n=1 Tax=Culicoides sonorensis TaxID=179676 RepID=A0A336KQM1_CULSO
MNKSNWSSVVKSEEKAFNFQEWPGLLQEVKKEEPEELEIDEPPSITNVTESNPVGASSDPLQFPSLSYSTEKKSRRKNRVTFKIAQGLTNEKPFEAKYSSKVRKKLTKTSNICNFMFKKPIKPLKNPDIERLMENIKKSEIVTFKGKKREIPKRKLSRLKKNILRIRAERNSKEIEIVSENIDDQTDDEELKSNIIESIQKLKLESNESEIKHEITLEPDSSSNPTEIIQHSRDFRPYCTNCTSELLCELTENIITQLRTFQHKQYQKNPERVKKRFVSGLNEAKKFLELKKIKLFIIATDLEPNPGPGGLDDTIQQMKVFCDENHIPYLFSLKRRKIGYILFKKVPVSCVAILNYEGCEEIYRQLMIELDIQRTRYKNARII